MLVDHADAPGDRIPRRPIHHLLPVQADRSGVGVVQAVEDVHEGRFARTVLPEERVDLVLADHEVDAVQRGEVAEPLHDAAHLDVRDEVVAHACPSVSYGMPSAAGGRERPTKPATARIVRTYGSVPSSCTGTRTSPRVAPWSEVESALP